MLATAGGLGAAGGRPGNTGWDGWGDLPGSSASPAEGVRVEHRNQRGWGVGVVGEGRRVGQKTPSTGRRQLELMRESSIGTKHIFQQASRTPLHLVHRPMVSEGGVKQEAKADCWSL